MTAGVPASTVHMIYDQRGRLIAEADASTGDTVREYIWFEGRPIAVVDDVDTGNPVIFEVHVDHLDRPIMMTDGSKAIVWRARYWPYGEVYSITGPESLDYRFPGQWFMLETGLHYNWHRWYDATTGRYTQPDPLGMPDGPNRYAYAKNAPQVYVDPDGRYVWFAIAGGALIGAGAEWFSQRLEFGKVCHWDRVAAQGVVGAVATGFGAGIGATAARPWYRAIGQAANGAMFGAVGAGVDRAMSGERGNPADIIGAVAGGAVGGAAGEALGAGLGKYGGRIGAAAAPYATALADAIFGKGVHSAVEQAGSPR